MASDSTELQINVLKRLWRRLYDAGTLTSAQILAYATGAAATVVDGTEVISVSLDGSSTSAVLNYPKEVVMSAALDLLDEIDDVASGANSSIVHSHLGCVRIET